MAAELQIQYTCKTQDSLNKISHIGGMLNGYQWKITLEDAIRGIESKTYNFYILLKGKAVDVYITSEKPGFKNLKTRADNSTMQYLLTLDECPAN